MAVQEKVMAPVLSVVIPTYQRQSQLRMAVQSVMDQTFTAPFEIIVVDDNPPDSEAYARNRTMFEKEFPGVRHLRNDRGRGGSGARNCGILAARGGWIAFLDDDDSWLPEKLSRQWELIGTAAAGVACVDTGFWEVDEASGRREAVLPKLQGNIFDDLLVKHNGRAPKLSTLVCRRDALIQVGMFDQDLPSRQDLDLYLRLARHYSFASVQEPLAVKNMHSGQRISTNPEKKIRGFQLFMEKYEAEFRSRPDLYRIFQRQFAKRLYRSRQYGKAMLALAKGILPLR
jgi:glycosyltransferase involved in cell wall biosynthesis